MTAAKGSKKRADELIAAASQGAATEPEEAKEDGVVEDGPALFDEIERRIREYLYLTDDHYYTTIVLWSATSHAIDHMEHATRLSIVSPEPQCGKTRALDLIEHLVHHAFPTINATTAAITRSISEKNPPTLIVDEADTIFGTKKAAEANEEFRGLLNAGHARDKFVVRWDITTRDVEYLRTFAPVALASIKSLPDTITDRSVVIAMRRRPKDHPIKPFRKRRDGRGVFAPLGKRLAAWVATVEWSDADVDLPVEDRAADNWESLVAMADAVGGNWPKRARAAALAMTSGAQTDSTFEHEALVDIRRVWEPGAIAMHSEDVVARMLDLEESPWPTYSGGLSGVRGLNPHRLARLLHSYGIRTRQVKIAGVNRQGYRLENWPCKTGEDGCTPSGGLQAAWDSYLDPIAEDDDAVYVDRETERATAAAKVFGAEPAERPHDAELARLKEALL